MNNLATQLDPATVVPEVGIVARVDGDVLAVEVGAREYRARCAAHCLVAPEVGDLVMVASLSNGQTFVVGILQRAASTPPVVTSEGGLAFRLKGALTVAAQEGIEFATSKAVQIVAGAVDVHAGDGSLVFRRLALLSGFMQAEIDRVRAFAVTVDSVIERVTERVKRVYRFVEESEQVRAERIDYVAKDTMRLHGDNAVITAEKLVKIDGEQIHVG